MAEVSDLRFGWKRDLPDFRDVYFEVPEKGFFPKSVDLRSGCPPIYDQGNLGSCTANAVAAHLDFNRKKQGEPFMTPSRLFIYYNERADDGDVESDSGSSIRESVKTVAQKGACPESEWPYIIDNFDIEPLPRCYEDAVKFEALKYIRLPQSELAFRCCLAQGFPFVVGITVYQSFMDKKPVKSLPSTSDSVLGGHAVLIVGYRADGTWIMRNSWGLNWGDKGYCYLPKEYLLNPGLSDDSWTIRKVK